MCSSYWNLRATITCPECGETYEGDYQTHSGGEAGACVEWFGLGEPIPYLAGFTGRLSAFDGDDLIAKHRDAVFHVDADVVNGAIVAVDIPKAWKGIGGPRG